jgi:hypothetical protein
VEQIAHGLAGLGEGTRITNRIMSGGTLAFKCPLGPFALLEIGERPASGEDPALAVFIRGVDEDDEVGEIGPAGFEEDGGVEEDQADGLVRAEFGNSVLDGIADDGVGDRFEAGASGGVDGGVAEDFGGEARADDVSVVAEEVVAELGGEGVAHGGIAEGGVAEFVGVEDFGGNVLGDESGDGAFACADAADEGEDGEGREGEGHQRVRWKKWAESRTRVAG